MVNRDLSLNIKQWPLQGQQKRLINKVTVTRLWFRQEWIELDSLKGMCKALFQVKYNLVYHS